MHESSPAEAISVLWQQFSFAISTIVIALFLPLVENHSVYSTFNLQEISVVLNKALFCIRAFVMKLDKIDFAIIESLQEHGRMTNVELAARAGISAPPCLRRLKFLEESGVINGYHADIDSSAVGFNLEAICFISLSSQAAKDVDRFLSEIKKINNVRSCATIIGFSDFMLTIVTRDLKHFEKLVEKEISNIQNVCQIKTLVVVKRHKAEYGAPIEKT